jgi:hypothetical protein
MPDANKLSPAPITSIHAMYTQLLSTSPETALTHAPTTAARRKIGRRPIESVSVAKTGEKRNDVAEYIDIPRVE